MRARMSGYLAFHLAQDQGLESWSPPDLEDFEFKMDFHACPEGENTGDAFTVRVCSHKWFFREFGDRITSAENTILMPRYHGYALVKFIEDYCASTEGETWEAIAAQLTRLGRWEFDYKL